MSRNGNDNGHSLPRIPFEHEEDDILGLTDDTAFELDAPIPGLEDDWRADLDTTHDDVVAHVSAVFGEPSTVGDRTVIPVAGVRHVYGFRGGWSSASPVAVVEIGPEGVKVRPVVNNTLIPLAGMLLAAWNVYWVMRTIRAWRAQTKESEKA